MYAKYIKRPMDFVLSLIALVVLSPILFILTIVGAIVMRGNPFFVQPRPGKNEKIFKLIKFRTMTCEKDENGNLFPDEKRLTKYGKFLRSTSLDELPELINIIKGDMSIVGPRPLLVQYLPLYNERQRQRHDVRPGLTGLAQVKGRNGISFEERFEYDLFYIKSLSLINDLLIIFETVKTVLNREGISSGTSATMEYFTRTPEEKEVTRL
jgi:lipopolysaccharide/colanic/teichoic acid biosynthesis glycosyltransferase